MSDRLYWLLANILDDIVWQGDLLGSENLPKEGPAVFVGNHLDALGPIAACCSIPLRLYPWIQAEMVDRRLASDYLRIDFAERQLHLRPPLSRWFSSFLSKITVPLLSSIGCIPVYHGDYELLNETLRLSVELLCQGKFLLVFPEDPNLPKNPVTGFNPFQHTFVRLAEMYYKEAGRLLKFYPIAIHPDRLLQVGVPISYNPHNLVGKERLRIKDLVESEVIRLYQLSDQTSAEAVQGGKPTVH